MPRLNQALMDDREENALWIEPDRGSGAGPIEGGLGGSSELLHVPGSGNLRAGEATGVVT